MFKFECTCIAKSTMFLCSKNEMRRTVSAAVTVLLLFLFVTLVPVVSSATTSTTIVPQKEVSRTISSKISDGNPNHMPVLKFKSTETTTLRAEADVNVGLQSSSDVKSPLHVAQCRATCLQKFNNRDWSLSRGSRTGTGTATTPLCFQQPDCFTCWRSCELLESVAVAAVAGGLNGKDKVGGMSSKPICSQPRICLSGCQAACKFYEILTSQAASAAEPVVPTGNQNVLQFLDDKIRWPKNPKEAGYSGPNFDSIVYLVVQQYSDRRWRQVAQTPMSEVDIPRGLNSQQSSNKLKSTRVLVVNPDGLITMYSPKPSPMEKDIVVTEENLWIETENPIVVVEESTPKIPDEELELKHVSLPPESSTISRDWNLRKVSLIHQKFLVIAELAWNEFPGAKDYIITWELDGGGLKGHLVTDSTVVTLSLWPDTIYHIQVELCGEEEEKHSSRKSFPLAVDTSEALFPMVQPSALSKTQSSHKSVTEFLNVTLLVTVSSFLFILLCLALGIFTWCRISARRRRSRELRLLQDMEESDSNDTTTPTSTITHSSIPKERKNSSALTVAVISNNQLIYSNHPSFLRTQPHCSFPIQTPLKQNKNVWAAGM